MHFGSVSEVPRLVRAREIYTFTDAKCITNIIILYNIHVVKQS